MQDSLLLSVVMVIALMLLPLTSYATQSATPSVDCPETLDFKLRPLLGTQAISLCQTYQNKVVLIVNTASKCGFTPQYEGLEALYDQYKDQGLVVLGFPSNDFGGQEPGTEAEIQNFCRSTYGVQFPMFEKVHASQAKAHPLYQKLGGLANEFPRWNFHKYLLDREGQLVGSYKSGVKPEQLAEKIEPLL